MKTAFALRRKEVITDNLTFRITNVPWLNQLLFCPDLTRFTNVNLKNHFYAVLDQHAPRLQSLFRKKDPRTGKVEKVDIRVQRAAILRSLPARLQEDDSNFLKTWDVEHSDEPDNDVPLGLLSICGILTDATLFCPEKIVVVLEERVWLASLHGNTITRQRPLLFLLCFGADRSATVAGSDWGLAERRVETGAHLEGRPQMQTAIPPTHHLPLYPFPYTLTPDSTPPPCPAGQPPKPPPSDQQHHNTI
ncbi:unnamed protein product [Leuciscus chuanchicus]